MWGGIAIPPETRNGAPDLIASHDATALGWMAQWRERMMTGSVGGVTCTPA